MARVKKTPKTTSPQEQQRQQRREARALLLEPNKGSDLKVEIYEFGLSKKVVLGRPRTFSMRNSPDVNFRISKLVANVTQPGMFYLRDFRVSNISTIIGGSVDAYNLKDLQYDYPTLTPANTVSACVEYTGLIPDSLKSMPAPSFTLDHLVAGLEEALKESDERTLRERVKELIESGPLFEFNISASGYATIVA